MHTSSKWKLIQTGLNSLNSNPDLNWNEAASENIDVYLRILITINRFVLETSLHVLYYLSKIQKHIWH